jgi:PAS domain S-box-containing protein
MTLKSSLDLHHLLDNMQTFVSILDTAGILIFANQSPTIQTGLIESDIIGKAFWESSWFQYDSNLINLIKQDCEACALGSSVKREIQISVNNELVWIDFSMQASIDNTGEITQLVVEARQITQQKQTAALLNDSERKSHAWLENSPICTKIVDLNFNLRYMSSAGVKSLKIKDINTFYNKPYPFEFYPSNFKQKMLVCLNQVINTKTITKLEAQVIDLNSNEIWFHSTLVPVLNKMNDLDYIIIVSIDISEQKNAEQELKQLNKELEARVIQRTKQLELANQQLKYISETD